MSRLEKLSQELAAEVWSYIHAQHPGMFKHLPVGERELWLRVGRWAAKQGVGRMLARFNSMGGKAGRGDSKRRGTEHYQRISQLANKARWDAYRKRKAEEARKAAAATEPTVSAQSP